MNPGGTKSAQTGREKYLASVQFRTAKGTAYSEETFMQSFIISMSDAGDGDWQNIAVVPTLAELPDAVQRAVQTLVTNSGEDLRFPLFIDIHPATQFEHVAWMHRDRAPHSSVSPSDALSN